MAGSSGLCVQPIKCLCPMPLTTPLSWLSPLTYPRTSTLSPAFIIRSMSTYWALSRTRLGSSLVAQWLRIRLPMQGTQVWSLVREDPTCHGATKPMHHNYWACAPEPACHNYWARVLQLLKPGHLEPVPATRSHRNEKPVHRTKSSPRSPQLEKARAQQGRPNTAKNKLKKKKN